MNITTPIILPQCVFNTLDYYSDLKEKRDWRIKWRGRILRGTTNKTTWKTEAAARAALFNLLSYGNTPYFLARENGHPVDRCHWKPETNEFVKVAIKQLEEAGEIEIVEVA